MDAATALKRLTNRAETYIEADKQARTALADALAKAPATDLTTQIDGAFAASAKAKPWRQLMKRIERHGVREGLAKQKAEALEVLLSYGMGMSTSLVTNAARLTEEDGLRRFLNAVDTIDIDEDDAPADDESDAAPQEATTEIPTPKATAAQKRTLQSIKEAGVKLQEFSIKDGMRVQTKPGHARPRRDMVEYAIAQGWAQRDTSAPLFRGQAVTLTAVGEAILAG